MSEKEILLWIRKYLSPIFNRALDEARIENPHLLYTESWIASIIMRETGFLIARHVSRGTPVEQIHLKMRGDYSQRPGETKKQYHGFGYMQIDINSFPTFVHSGDWKDPYKTFVKAIRVLEGKRIYLQKKFPSLGGDQLRRAIMAAYNCGEGNVYKVLKQGADIDSRTHQKNYSKEVWRYRAIYNLLPKNVS